MKFNRYGIAKIYKPFTIWEALAHRRRSSIIIMNIHYSKTVKNYFNQANSFK